MNPQTQTTGAFVLAFMGATMRISNNGGDWSPVSELILNFVRDGWTLSYEPAPPAQTPTQNSNSPPAYKGAWAKANGTHPHKAGPSRPKAKAEPKRKAAAPATDWATGATVWLNWPELAEDGKLKLSNYRNTSGIVEEHRSGQGIRKTVGVRFNSDPELTWLAPAELSAAPIFS